MNERPLSGTMLTRLDVRDGRASDDQRVSGECPLSTLSGHLLASRLRIIQPGNRVSVLRRCS